MDFNYKSFYNKEIADHLSDEQARDLMIKFHGTAGVIKIMQGNKHSFHSVTDKETLVKTLMYYNNRDNVKSYWFYLADLKRTGQQLSAL